MTTWLNYYFKQRKGDECFRESSYEIVESVTLTTERLWRSMAFWPQIVLSLCLRVGKTTLMSKVLPTISNEETLQSKRAPYNHLNIMWVLLGCHWLFSNHIKEETLCIWNILSITPIVYYQIPVFIDNFTQSWIQIVHRFVFIYVLKCHNFRGCSSIVEY